MNMNPSVWGVWAAQGSKVKKGISKEHLRVIFSTFHGQIFFKKILKNIRYIVRTKKLLKNESEDLYLWFIHTTFKHVTFFRPIESFDTKNC